jgi:23S rRNA pseudouridine1911/1915/1917 synthase
VTKPPAEVSDPSAEGAAGGARRLRCTVGEEEGGARLDRFLATRGFLPTRSRIAGLIRGGHVTVDGRVRKASFPVPPGAAVEVEIPPEPPSTVEPEAIPLDVLHEDAWLVAINKPAGMASHPAPGSRYGTLVAALLHRWNLGNAWPDPQRPGIVHRLDRDTTGVIVVAKTPDSMHHIARQFAERTVAKTYTAIALGVPRESEGTIDLPIGRDPVDRRRMQARAGQQRPALTRYSVLAAFGGEHRIASLLSLTPESGRTHQIRVHLASVGHPLVGDSLYGSGRARRGASAGDRALLESFPRQALHAASLRLRHPQDGRWVEFAAPLAADMRELLAAMQARRDAPASPRNVSP